MLIQAPLIPPPMTTSSVRGESVVVKPQLKPQTVKGPDYYVELVSPQVAIERTAEWDDLARNAVEPNPFYESWMMKHALNTFGTNVDLQFALVYWFTGRPQDPRKPQLCGLFPLEKHRTFHSLPIRYWSLWRHYYASLCTPLVRKGHISSTLDAFFQWVQQVKNGPAFLEWDAVHGEGPLHQGVIDVLRPRGQALYVLDSYNRALLRPAANAEEYSDLAMTCHNRQEQRRLNRRLSELGQLEFRQLDQPAELEKWIELFLNLEGCGWKGSEQTALRANPLHSQFFTDIARSAFERQQLSLMGLFLNDRPIAVKCNFHSQEGSFAFKIGFDEMLAKYSPGVQLELENIRWVHEHPEVAWMDSCAKPVHFMINRLWKDRRTINHELISTGHRSSELILGLLPFWRGLRRFCRGLNEPQTPSN